SDLFTDHLHLVCLECEVGNIEIASGEQRATYVSDGVVHLLNGFAVYEHLARLRDRILRKANACFEIIPDSITREFISIIIRALGEVCLLYHLSCTITLIDCRKYLCLLVNLHRWCIEGNVFVFGRGLSV